MNIQGNGNQGALLVHQNRQMRGGEAGRKGVLVKQQFTAKVELKVSEQVKYATQPEEAPQVHQANGKAKGVMRHLDEGHFKGVADIRLRMNFHGRIESAGNAKALDYLEEESNILLGEVGDKVLGIGEEFDFATEVEGFFSEFATAVEEMFGRTGDSESKPSSIFASFRDAFTNLFTSLEGLSPVSTEQHIENSSENDEGMVEVLGVSSEIVDNLPSTSVTDAEIEIDQQRNEESTVEAVNGIEELAEEIQMQEDPASNYSESLNDLQQWFTSRLNAMESVVDELLSLPPLSASGGNGVAYNRFLAMYSEMSEVANEDQGSIQEKDGVSTEV